ncbi:pentatricopeptide repeat-containing protein [Tanacetum coccineum]
MLGKGLVDKGKGLAEKGKGLVDKGKGIMEYERKAGRNTARTRNSGIVIGENVNPTFSEDDDTDSERCYGNKERDKSEAKKSYQSTGGSSTLVAGCSRPTRMYDMGETLTVIEHEEYMDTLMHPLRGKGDDLLDPFTILDNDQIKEKFPTHDDQTHWKMRKPKVGEKYVDAAQLKKCLTYYSLANGFSLWFYKSSKDSLIARCGRRPEKLKDIEKGKQKKQIKYPTLGANEGSNCPFKCYGRMMLTESSFQVISLNEEHICVRDFKYGNLVTYKWIAKHFGHKIRQNPVIKLHEIADLVLKKYKCIVSLCQCRYAKTKALNEGENTIQEHYAMIRSYGKEILDTNDVSTVKLGVTVNPDDKTYFDRFYCCFYGLKRGFQLGCRPVIALDGCFLKKPNVGEIITAVGRDGNNHIYPIAWAIVNVENKDNWSWFLELLGEDIDMPIGNGLTLILDQHKGFIEAVKDVMPLAEHRQCARHIYEGFRKQYSGVEFKELFWAASKASSNCEVVENGFSECFNSVLVLVGNKPLITMLESMRVILMERFWHVIPAGGNLFEVRNGSEAFRVDEHNRTCTCRMWQLSGLPCPHSIDVLFKLNKRPEDYIPTCFRKEAYFKAYHQYMTPVGGMTFWPDSSMYSTVLPPKPRTMPGRPRKQRIRAPHEKQFPNRVSRAGVEMTCQNYFEKGHNKSSCTKPTVIPPTKQPAKRGRPKKNVVTVEDGGDYTFDMGSAGVEAETNVGARGAEGEPSVTTTMGEGELSVTTARGTSSNLAEFVSVRCEGATSVTTARGRGGVRRGTSGSIEIQKEPNEQPTPATQQSQVGTQQTAEDGRQDQASQNLRPRSERIMKKRLSSSIDGSGSSNTNPHALD